MCVIMLKLFLGMKKTDMFKLSYKMTFKKVDWGKSNSLKSLDLYFCGFLLLPSNIRVNMY